MAIVTPYVPERITVHLGSPSSQAANVTLSFVDYVKNVASSEIYPTWDEDALRANIYAIVSFALNRVYTEWYRSRGYDYDITNSTAYDQYFVNGRSYFTNISRLVDELFNDYLRRPGFVEPLAAKFCNGTTAVCEGLSQWGSENLAQQGYTYDQILRSYYGNVEIVNNAPIQGITSSYPGRLLRRGTTGPSVVTIQVALNRISQNYPAIPKIPQPNGFFGPETTAAVREFQKIFNLPVTGIIDKATWYKTGFIYVSVKRLAELDSEGISLSEIPRQHEYDIAIGSEGALVKSLQYYLAVIGAYYENVIPTPVTGYFGKITEDAVKSFQRVFGLPETGIADLETWNDLYRAYAGIVESVPIDPNTVTLYPGNILKEGITDEYVRILQEYLTFISNTYPDIPPVNPTGYFGPVTKASVTAFQKRYGIPANGVVGADTWNEIATVYSDLRFGSQKQAYQFPGYTIR
jgi:peptidoglycan hydrolase-like protein with peptidoglycan-binding domain